MYSFSNQTVLITGGSRGLGADVALAFLQAGADVVICSRNTPEQLPAFNNKQALFFQCDVRQPESSQQLVDFCIEKTGRLDVLINNAGGSPEVVAANASPKLTQAIVALNLTAPAVLSQQAYQSMVGTTGTGSIINIASVSAQRPSPGTAAYGAAKAGLVNLTRSLAQEWAPQVRVNVIVAGLARTENSANHYGGEAGIQKIEQNMPMQRMLNGSDMAKACLYLASDDANYISGATLEVHGGGEPPAFLRLQH